MAKAVFATKIEPTYDDLPEVQYHFPASYLRRVQASIGDWIIYYEPRRKGNNPNSTDGRQVYFATARITGITQDPLKSDHYYAHVSDFLEFDTPVPFKEGAYYYENALVKEDGTTNKGAFGHAVRILPDHEYESILAAGFAPILKEKNLDRKEEAIPLRLQDNDQEGLERPIIERVSKRPFRDAAFSKAVKTVYQQTCAMTGIKIVNGGGRSEVHAAHIMPVERKGPDSIRNGIALCGTIHWMFDRGLISIDDDYSILKTKGKIPQPLEQLFNSDDRLILPSQAEYQPHRKFLQFHRESVFKG